jgi:hypothetical protein
MIVTRIVAVVLCISYIGLAPPALAIPTDKPGTYNYYQGEGNAAATRGDFSAAIAAWEKAARLPGSGVGDCRGEGQRVQIRAAKDAKMRMIAHHLSKAMAGEWFWQRELSLWTPDRCNTP